MPTAGQIVSLATVAGAVLVPMAAQVPAPYGMVLTSLIAFLGSLWHLYQALPAKK